MPNQENERKWVVKEVPNELLREDRESQIIQPYLSVTEDGEVRLRKREYPSGKIQLSICVKRGKGQNRKEVTTPIMSIHFNQLREAAIGTVQKWRYEVPLSKVTTSFSWKVVEWNQKIVEIDVYDDEDLVIAEIEDPPSDIDEKLPEWFGKELTEDERYKNKWIATEGCPE